MPIVCFDPVTGAAGNMILGALLDLGAEPGAVDAAVRSTGLHGYTLRFERSAGPDHLVTGLCTVDLDGHHHDHHEHRGLHDCLEIVGRAQVAPRARARAAAIFRRLADAEAAVHGITPDQVHFHEVGAVDAIVDILGTCVALEQLDAEQVYCGEFKTGTGTVRCAHGLLPVPAPATAKLLEGFPLRRLDIEAELTTPTGAAILTTLSQGDWGQIEGRLLRCGMARGTRVIPGHPNLIRAFLLDRPAGVAEAIEIIECDLDDDSPEVVATLPDLLRGAGARDATLTPLLMKKGRAGVRLTVLAQPAVTAALVDLLFRHSSTIGVRVLDARRFVLPRGEETVQTPHGPVRCKRIERPHGVELAPEFESARELAQRAGVPLRDVMAAARRGTAADGNPKP